MMGIAKTLTPDKIQRPAPCVRVYFFVVALKPGLGLYRKWIPYFTEASPGKGCVMDRPQSNSLIHGDYEYRCQGGEIHRRPKDREGVLPFHAAWLVIDGTKAPSIVRNHFANQFRPFQRAAA